MKNKMCGKNLHEMTPGSPYCLECKCVSQKKRRDKLKKNNICTNCGSSSAVPGKTECQACLDIKKNIECRRVRTKHGSWLYFKKAAKRKNHEVTITEEQYHLLRSQPCFYCGNHITQLIGGIDRIDSSKGYIDGNCRPCCIPNNEGKNNRTEEEYCEHICRTYHVWASSYAREHNLNFGWAGELSRSRPEYPLPEVQSTRVYLPMFPVPRLLPV